MLTYNTEYLSTDVSVTVSDGEDSLEFRFGEQDYPDEAEGGAAGECPGWLMLPDGGDPAGERPPRTMGEALGMGFHFLQQGADLGLRLNGLAVRPDSLGQTSGDEIGAEEIVAFDGLRLPLLCALRAGRIPIRKTPRGFGVGEFKDAYGSECSIQKSSSADRERIWLGVVRDYDGNAVSARMHLDQGQAAALIPLLVNFVQTGTLDQRPWAPGDGPPPADQT